LTGNGALGNEKRKNAGDARIPVLLRFEFVRKEERRVGARTSKTPGISQKNTQRGGRGLTKELKSIRLYLGGISQKREEGVEELYSAGERARRPQSGDRERVKYQRLQVSDNLLKAVEQRT